MQIKEIIAAEKERLKKMLTTQELALGEIIFNNGQCQLLTQSVTRFELIVSDESKNEVAEYSLDIEEDGRIVPVRGKEAAGWDKYAVACLLQVENEMHLLNPKEHLEHKKYTRQGMIKRVLAERRQKADKAEYRIKWADNIYGDHISHQRKRYKIQSVFARF
jgi:hypothetical protein